jgi:hypothetical protein
MRKTMRTSVVVPCLGVAVFWAQVAVAQTAKGGSLTDSPYKNGPPPVSGGYTDTSQGGTKTSGDMPVLPPGAAGQDKAAKNGQQPKDAHQQAAPQGEKGAGGTSGG